MLGKFKTFIEMRTNYIKYLRRKGATIGDQL